MPTAQPTDFEQQQLSYDRVRIAYGNKQELFEQRCSQLGISKSFGDVFIRAFKYESELEVWVRNKGEWQLFQTYPICAASGRLGPKRKQGDQQVPEGFYRIQVFNPLSNYWLSLGINYPNESDRKLSTAEKLGGDIYIHGDCASIGCLAMTDGFIEEIYLMAVKARAQGQQDIPVHIFPFRMTDKNMAKFTVVNRHKNILEFWSNLLQGYMWFEEQKQLPRVRVDERGYYSFTEK